MKSIEIQVQEGGTGDFYVGSSNKDENFSIQTTVIGKVYNPRGTDVTAYTPGRPMLYRLGSDPDKKDAARYRNKNETEKPAGEWNTVKIIAKGNTLNVYLNGQFVNHAYNVKPQKGRIQIQSEGAEFFYRRIDLTPLPKEANPLPRFAVISDTHFENNRGEGARVKVPKALKNLLSKEPKMDAVFVVGDLTDKGKPEEFDQLVSVFGDKSNVPEGMDVYFMMAASHDGSFKNQEIFKEKVKQPLHQYTAIKGYPFITISEGGYLPSEYNTYAKKFLSESLADAVQKYPGKPIFVFTHIPPQNTCYGSKVSEGWGTPFFTSLLNQYPQVIIFSGHSHFPLGDPRSIHQNKFTAVNDGSTTYSEVEPKIVDEGIHPPKCEYVTEGVIVNVLPTGDVEIERWDTYRNEKILPDWLVEAPHDGSRFCYKNRSGLPAPIFEKDAKPAVKITGKEVAVTFPQASDEDAVFRYLVEIMDGDKVIASFRKFSQFYLGSAMPKELTVPFNDLPAGKELRVRTTAIDSYNNQSQPIISEAFSIGTQP
jgi:predicted phosphodiesterase